MVSSLFLALCLCSTGVDVGDVASTMKAPGPCPTGLAWDGALLWAADRRTDRIYALDPETGKIVNELEAPGYWPTGLAFDGEQLWIADRDGNKGYRLDVERGLFTRTLELDVVNAEGLAWDGSHLWCVDGKADLIVKIDPGDGTALVSHPAPSDNPTGLGFDGQFLWVADRVDDAIYRVDPRTGHAVMKLPSPGAYPYGMAWTEKGLWCADYQGDTMDRLCLDGTRKALVSNTRRAGVEYVTDLINFGPGIVETADFYVAVPTGGDNQVILGEIVFEPEPDEFVTDHWGQRFAHFHFQGIGNGERASAVMRLNVEMNDVLYLLFPEKVGRLEDIPRELRERYLTDGSKYDVQHDFITEVVRGLEDTNVLDKVLSLYDFVTDSLRYNLVGGWNAAPTVLQRGTGSCSEYTFSFISLCRAAGIPARYAGGLSVRGDDASFDNVFHRWTEVYLPGYGWIPFDPSRGDKPKPADRLKGMGWLANTLLITTRGGGDSEYIGWQYNADIRWTGKGKCNVKTENLAEWEPLDKESP